MLFGTARLIFSLGSWNGQINIENPVDKLGRPIDMFTEPVLILGSHQYERITRYLSNGSIPKAQRQLRKMIRREAEKLARDERDRLKAAMTEHDRALREALAALKQVEAERDAAQARLSAALDSGAKTADDLASLRAERDKARTERDEAAARAQRAVEERDKALAELRRKLDTSEAELARNRQIAELRKQLTSLQAVLDASEARDFANVIQVQTMGTRLNTVLAQLAAARKRAAQLEADKVELLRKDVDALKAARSGFLARTKKILEGVEGVDVVGDRFVFSSHVLFLVGSAELSKRGMTQLSRLASVIRQIAPSIPPDVNWILRVDGHTDKTGSPEKNWELSQQRALSVVRYLTEFEGIDPKRLSANGFGQYQPLAQGDDPESLAKNRRIELKFTER